MRLFEGKALEDLEIYKELLDGKIERFPKGFWDKTWTYKSTAYITRYLIEEILGIDKTQNIPKIVRQEDFREYKLYGMLQTVFHGSYIEAIQNAYPEIFKEWEFKNLPITYWNEDNIIKATKWLIEVRLGYKRDKDIVDNISANVFSSNGLRYLIKNYSLYELINKAYPDKFKSWQFRHSPIRWNDDIAVTAIKWLVETKLKCETLEDIKIKLTEQSIRNYNMGGILSLYSIKELINMAYK